MNDKYSKLVGLTFNKLTCIEHAELDTDSPSQSKYIFLCECGNTRIARFAQVKRGTTKSCLDCTSKLLSEVHTGNTTRLKHGETGTSLYFCWYGMRARCKHKDSYANRTYAPEWEDFAQFKADMGETYFPGATLDRINNDGDYCKDNCQWLTKAEHGVKSAKERNNATL